MDLELIRRARSFEKCRAIYERTGRNHVSCPYCTAMFDAAHDDAYLDDAMRSLEAALMAPTPLVSDFDLVA